MNHKDRCFEYLKFIRKWWEISSIFEITFLLILWLLNYKIAFYILLSLKILGCFEVVEKIKKLETEAGLRWQ